MESQKTQPLLGVLLVLAAASLWGTTGTSQALAGGGLAPAWFGALRLVAAALFFVAFAALVQPGAFAHARRLPRSALVCAGLAMAVYNLAFFAGVKLTGVALGTAVALGSGPVWAGVLQAVVQKKPPAPAWWLGAALAIAGGVLMAFGSGGGGGDEVGSAGAGAQAAVSVAGLALCLAAGLAYAAYTVANQRLAPMAPAVAITLPAFALAALLAVPAALLEGGVPAITARDLVAVAWTGFVSAGVAYLLYSHALRHVGGATAVTLALFEPVVAFGLAVAVLGEAATAGTVLGLALVIAGVLAVVRQELRAVTP
jgi:DME family drug/metabolite transporter